MISYEEALGKVLDNPLELGVEKVSLLESRGRVLAEDIIADRDFPPFNRSTRLGLLKFISNCFIISLSFRRAFPSLTIKI